MKRIIQRSAKQKRVWLVSPKAHPILMMRVRQQDVLFIVRCKGRRTIGMSSVLGPRFATGLRYITMPCLFERMGGPTPFLQASPPLSRLLNILNSSRSPAPQQLTILHRQQYNHVYQPSPLLNYSSLPRHCHMPAALRLASHRRGAGKRSEAVQPEREWA